MTTAWTSFSFGLAAGAAILVGLPIARRRGVSERLRSQLGLAAAGVLLFLIIEVGYHVMEIVEARTTDGASGAAVSAMGLLILGFTAGMVGLAWIDERLEHDPERSRYPLHVATMIALVLVCTALRKGWRSGSPSQAGLSRSEPS